MADSTDMIPRMRAAVAIMQDLVDIQGEKMTSHEYIALRDAIGVLSARVLAFERFSQVTRG